MRLRSLLIAGLFPVLGGPAQAADGMPQAFSDNPEWRAAIRRGFARLHPEQIYLKMSLYASSWFLYRDDTTQRPRFRQIGAWVAARGPDGKCRLFRIDRQQVWDGDGFGDDIFRSSGVEDIPCSAVGRQGL